MPVISFCGSAGANTGGVDCDIRRGKPVLFIVGSHKFTTAETLTAETFTATLLALMKLNTGNPEKMYAFPPLRGITNNTPANTEGTLGDGTTIVLGEGAPGFTGQLLIGSNTEKAIRKFNGLVLPVITLDANGVFWGTEDALGNFFGTQALLFTSPKPYSDGTSVETEVATTSVRYLSAADFSDNASAIESDVRANQLEGLVDVRLSEASVSNTNARKIKVKFKNVVKGKDFDFYDKYSTDLADVNLWSAHSGSNFQTPLTITSVVVDATLKAWTVTLDSTAYTALAANSKIKLELVGPEELDAADVIGIEGTPVVLTKTA